MKDKSKDWAAAAAYLRTHPDRKNLAHAILREPSRGNVAQLLSESFRLTHKTAMTIVDQFGREDQKLRAELSSLIDTAVEMRTTPALFAQRRATLALMAVERPEVTPHVIEYLRAEDEVMAYGPHLVPERMALRFRAAVQKLLGELKDVFLPKARLRLPTGVMKNLSAILEASERAKQAGDPGPVAAESGKYQTAGL